MSKKPKVSAPNLPYIGRVASYLNDSMGANPIGVKGGIPRPISIGGSITQAPRNGFGAMIQTINTAKATNLGGVN